VGYALAKKIKTPKGGKKNEFLLGLGLQALCQSFGCSVAMCGFGNVLAKCFGFT